MATRRQVERLAGELGELLSSHEGDVDLERFTPYRTDPVGFSREVLKDDPGPWADQVEVMEAVRDHDRVSWRSGQGVGKGWTIARLSLWWAYSVGGLVLISAPTSRTVHEATMRRELARAFRRAGLPGSLYVNALRIRDEEPSILAYTTSQASGGTGHHDSAVLAILDEAQGCEREAWEMMLANIVGEDDTFLATGNPLEPAGPFFEVSRPDSGWYTVQTSALEHPNLVEGHPRYIPGGPSEGWLERMGDMWGRGSPMWTARVEGEFPTDAVEGLYRREWVDDAIEKGRDGAWTSQWEEKEPVVAVDVARHGLDSSVAAVVRGHHVVRLEGWQGASTTETAKRVRRVAREAGLRRDLPPDVGIEGEPFSKFRVRPWGRIIVDEVGVGAGVLDQLSEDRWSVEGFKASRKATDRRRFRDVKAESAWRLRTLLEERNVALPDDRRLREELLAVKWSPDSRGRVAVESKDDIRSRLGRSPDRLDAVMMAVWGVGSKKDVGNAALVAGI